MGLVVCVINTPVVASAIAYFWFYMNNKATKREFYEFILNGVFILLLELFLLFMASIYKH